LKNYLPGSYSLPSKQETGQDQSKYAEIPQEKLGKDKIKRREPRKGKNQILQEKKRLEEIR